MSVSKKERLSHRGEIGITVKRAYQDKHIGNKLLKEIIYFAKYEAKLDILSLEVRSDNIKAIHLYSKFGFVTVGIFDDYMKINNQSITVNIMRLDLKADSNLVNFSYSFYTSPIGKLFLAELNGCFCNCSYVDLIDNFDFLNKKELIEKDTKAIIDAKKWLDDYFAKKNPKPMEVFYLKGTKFQKDVWTCLRGIEYGYTITYGQIAKYLAKLYHKEKISAQAVGTAISYNPIVIFIPCHRVIGANKRLSGYDGGVERKKYLLKLENQDVEFKE